MHSHSLFSLNLLPLQQIMKIRYNYTIYYCRVMSRCYLHNIHTYYRLS